MIKLIIGLGNPGEKYAATRHNAGFWFVDGLAKILVEHFQKKPRLSAEVVATRFLDEPLLLAKTADFMNRSGVALGHLLRFYKIDPNACLVVHDDLDFPPGVARFKFGGGDGGHNGLKDIIRTIGRDFHRLRIGIGRPQNQSEVVDFVLRPPPKIEQEKIQNTIETAVEAVFNFIPGDVEKAMGHLHQKPS